MPDKIFITSKYLILFYCAWSDCYISNVCLARTQTLMRPSGKCDESQAYIKVSVYLPTFSKFQEAIFYLDQTLLFLQKDLSVLISALECYDLTAM